MEVRDPVHGTIELNESEAIIFESPEFQRLRSIKQLGFSEFSFPGAVHNRLIHSVGVCHLAGSAFDKIFAKFVFSSKKNRQRLRQTLRLGAFLHDIGHGPLSHSTEEVMPSLAELNIKAYNCKSSTGQITVSQNPTPQSPSPHRRANHEDYTIKYVTEAPLSDLISKNFPDIEPLAVAALIDKTINPPGTDFFYDQGLDFRPILSQLVSSELDVDRMDYLERDSFFCGTNYGKIDLGWVLSNLLYHIDQNKIYLCINRRALYTFDDFLISRHHMHLMVYFHHKSIVYEEMLVRYLTSPDCGFALPPDLASYTKCTDFALYQHLAQTTNPWAQRIALRQPYRMLSEFHYVKENPRTLLTQAILEKEGIDVIHASSHTRLSKYHTSSPEDQALTIYVVDQYDRWDHPQPIEQCTEIFKKYEETRIIDRLYVAPENYKKAEKIIKEQKV